MAIFGLTDKINSDAREYEPSVWFNFYMLRASLLGFTEFSLNTLKSAAINGVNSF